MKTAVKKLFTMVLVVSVICSGLVFAAPKQASAKMASKVTKVITLTSNKKAVTHHLSIRAKETVFVKVKFLEVKGSISLKSGEGLYFGEYFLSDSMGSLFNEWSNSNKLKKSAFKKGKVLSSKDDEFLYGKAEVDWSLPSGLKKCKVQITYYTKSKKAGIRSVK